MTENHVQRRLPARLLRTPGRTAGHGRLHFFLFRGPFKVVATLAVAVVLGLWVSASATPWATTANTPATPAATTSSSSVSETYVLTGAQVRASTPGAVTRSLPTAEQPGPGGPAGPGGPDGDGSVNIDINGLTDDPSAPVISILMLSLLALGPAIVLTCTSFTKILIVLSLTRNALGLQQTPPNQVLTGLALFLSLFIMAPVLTQMNEVGLQPYLDGSLNASQAFSEGVAPLREFMLRHTDQDELKLLTTLAERELPATPADIGLTTLIPAFILTELKQAFIIGFVIFVPFLIIDIVVSGALMALGMMMMPPVIVSLPFKLLLFVLVDGWGLIVEALVKSYGT